MMSAFTIFGQRHRTCFAPVALQAECDSSTANPSLTSPLAQIVLSPIYCNGLGLARIIGLGVGVSPLHIPSFVMSVIINAIEGMLSRRSPSYMAEKFLVRSKAEFNPPATPSMKVSNLRVLASTLGGGVRSVLYGAVRLAVGGRFGNGGRDASTPTGLSALSEAVATGDNPFSAVTLTQPQSITRKVSANVADDEQSSKFLSAPVFSLGMRQLRNVARDFHNTKQYIISLCSTIKETVCFQHATE